MALGRWWNPFGRKSRPTPGGIDGPEAAESLAATAPMPMSQRPIELSTTAPAPAPAPQARQENERLIARATGRRRSLRLASSWAPCATATTTTR